MPRTPRSQRGIYAIEYAFVFLLFFGIVYTIVCYGVLFTFRLGLQSAAEDAARAGLRHRSGATVQQSLQARLSQAQAVALARTQGWKPLQANMAIEADVCQPATGTCVQAGGTPDCASSDWAQRCHIRVQVTLSQLDRVLPPIPFPLPERLAGRASVLLERVRP